MLIKKNKLLFVGSYCVISQNSGVKYAKRAHAQRISCERNNR